MSESSSGTDVSGSGLNKGLGTVEVRLRWDPSPMGEADNDLDLVAAVYDADGGTAYLVHFDSRSPDGTITLTRDSHTGQGFGTDEAMKLEFDRMAEAYTRVVVGVVIQQNDGRKPFSAVQNAEVAIFRGYDELAVHDLGTLGGNTAATVAEFVRPGGESGWEFRHRLRGFDAGPDDFPGVMGKV
ncbi:TerD family protein [Streptomyces sp. RKND-216]|uniref:TerD family protein n=1 Tax=Streptomyces sp. RKND-216 TaxID=2562581 RepID=UPI001FF9C5D1|nr:TerD family protein [Streptomyces sp. RKND-216]